MMVEFNFDDELNYSNGQITILAEILSPFFKKTDGYRGDFIDNYNNKLEVKHERRSIEETANFFVERYGDVEKKTPGGPWKAHNDFCRYYLFCFSGKQMFWFDNIPLFIKRCNSIIRNQNICLIKNKSWTTGGYPIRREKFADLYMHCSFDEWRIEVERKIKETV